MKNKTRYLEFLLELGMLGRCSGFQMSIIELNRLTVVNDMIEEMFIEGEICENDYTSQVENIRTAIKDPLITQEVGKLSAKQSLSSVFFPLDKLISNNDIKSWSNPSLDLVRVVRAARNVIEHCHEEKDFEHHTVEPLRELLEGYQPKEDYDKSLIIDFLDKKNRKESWRIALFVYEGLGIRSYVDLLDISYPNNLTFKKRS